MTTTADLLIEIGTEELPPKTLNKLSAALTEHFCNSLKEAGISYNDVTTYSSPRRLALMISDVTEFQADQQVEKRGPAVKAAFDKEGNPSKAAMGFARSCGVEFDQLQQIETDKGAYLNFKQEIKGSASRDLVADMLTKALAALPIAKRMRWGDSDTEFVRPVHWVVFLLGNDVVDAEILGIKTGRESRGHRFHHPETISISTPADYAPALKQGYVLVDQQERRATIADQAKASAASIGGEAVIDEDLLDEVTNLVEWPMAVDGCFGAEFLEVPQECLISSMQDHQKYFPVVDANGNLMPHFITISNIQSSDPSVVRDGNERVIRPRFSDAAFFWQQDCKVPLASHREATKKIVFQQKLGTLFEKTERVSQLAGHIATALGENADHATRAAQLCKCDLASDMVNEFSDLQGIMGRYYALKDGEPESVAYAIEEQYKPGFAGDDIPAYMTGKILSLSDKLDTILGIFAIGQKPTGTKDPFALRRAALGVLRIIIEGDLSLDLRELLTFAAGNLQDKVDATAAVEDTYQYIMERLRAYYQDQNVGMDVVDAVSALNIHSPIDFDHRVKAVNTFKELPEAVPLAAANKRIANILKKLDKTPDTTINAHLFVEAQESALNEAIALQQNKVAPLLANNAYTDALSSLAAIRPEVDAFFDGVMIMSDDEALKNNRLALLTSLRGLFLQVADLSSLQGA
ncbi:glycine--tRNA ligase subunit beta [Leucothrix pacifica]|uniref:Glycine--tRNA ligase beta subunit n=1 Tax=Leucothrix pacifica TaxID=1247513 RepID=A0A317CMB3_9GAMM|nr:glycine--tRNA ligase subunit beta [Leucothrix pacifica]PWQ99755.1 glycine--tRNA ligase subunit beta [Leucothrix pacifica]